MRLDRSGNGGQRPIASAGGGAELDLPSGRGFLVEMDRLSEVTSGMADLIADLLEEGPRDAWTAREAVTWNTAEAAREAVCRSLSGGTSVAFESRLFQLVLSEWKVLRALRKVATRLWSCADDRASPESQGVRDLVLVLSAVIGELRAAVACLASGSRRPKALEHCDEVRRLARATRDVDGPLAAALAGGEMAALGRLVAWDSALASVRRASDACVEAASLIEIVVGEA